ncbi:DEAD/DEAH box helicase [Candidatus Bipolaricaulota bacterium]|nr:DEAD/DEAH box helicase [Candidatus Bipolaricaulota bacterium]
MSFERFSFDRRIAAGVKSMGYTTPTPIQAKAIPVVLQGRDMLGLAQTGTGKTAAFVLPILQRLSQGPRGKVRALIVAPTRELAEQIHQETSKLAGDTKIRSVTIYGGVGKGPQLAALKRGVEIVVACPGRLLDHVDAGTLDLSNVEVLVLDEADRMCDMGFLPDIKRIIRQVPEKRQTLFFSATMPKDIRALADKILTSPETVQIGIIEPAKTVSHALYPVPEDRRKELLAAMLQRTATGRVLIFTRTKHRASSLAIYMQKNGHRAAALQGNMSQSQRQEAINGFRKGKIDVLVATDIAARGIDVSQISHVVNFDMPDTMDAYTHRIGRTGRIGSSGEAFTFAIRGDGLMVKQIEKTLGTRLERRRLPEFEYGSGFDPERQFPQTSSKSSSLPRSFGGRSNRHR